MNVCINVAAIFRSALVSTSQPSSRRKVVQLINRNRFTNKSDQQVQLKLNFIQNSIIYRTVHGKHSS